MVNKSPAIFVKKVALMMNEEPKKMKTEKNEKKYKKAGMVGWYDPGQLAKTAIEVVISETLGRHSDRRITQALATSELPPDKPYHDMSEETGDFWLDYVSDVGDGFNSTCTMAYYLTEPVLKLNGENTLPGKVLVFGGDEVYPIASQKFYEEKLLLPYNAVFSKKRPGNPEAPKAFAVPGNHDWYDSIVGFSFHFLERHFAAFSYFCGWRTVQDRSYFAVKLPAGWWLFGTDMQLGSSLDSPQMKYFHDLTTKHVGKDEKIILCNAEPYWVTQAMFPENEEFNNKNMGFFEGHILQRKTAVFIAGDRHYYRRHAEMSKGEMVEAGFIEETETTKKAPSLGPDQRKQKIVAGGGGAFLHPTHKENVEYVGKSPTYKLEESFPDKDTSSKLGRRTLLFPFYNLKFGLVTAVLYMLTARSFLSTYLGQFGPRDVGRAILAAIRGILTEPFALFWVIAIILGFFLFTDKKSKRFRFIAGTLHFSSHLAAVFLISWLTACVVNPTAPPMYWRTTELLWGAAILLVGGYAAGSLIMGAYLYISLNWCGHHHNESFSALKIQDYKNFVRFKIDGVGGKLTIYPIGVKEVIKDWPDPPDPTKPNQKRIKPKSTGPSNKPFLIEGPIYYVKPPAADVSDDDDNDE